MTNNQVAKFGAVQILKLLGNCTSPTVRLWITNAC